MGGHPVEQFKMHWDYHHLVYLPEPLPVPFSLYSKPCKYGITQVGDQKY